MREIGFEPMQALSYHGLNVAHLTALTHPHIITIFLRLLKLL